MYPLTAGLVIGIKEIGDQIRRALEANSVRVLFELPEIPEDWTGFLDRIERVAPDVILLEDWHSPLPLQDVVERIRSTTARPAVFALHQSADAEAILAALRAGVSEFLYPPFDVAMKAALDRLSVQRERERDNGKSRGKVVAFLSAKGGCGATTVAAQVAVELNGAAPGKVLLADLDLQSGILGFLLKSKSSYTFADAANNIQRLDPSYWKAIVSSGVPGLDLITAPSAPSAKDVPPREAIQVLAFARTQYDWTLMDLGRGLTPFNLSMLQMADQTFLVTTNDIPALHQARQIIQTLAQSGYGRSNLFVILNRTPKHSDVTLQDLENMLGMPIYATLPSDPQALEDSYAEGRLLDESSTLGKSFSRLAQRIAGAEVPKRKLFSLFG